MTATAGSTYLLSRNWRTNEATGGQRWRDSIRALHQYWRRDMRDAREQRQELYPKSHSLHVQRTVPFVWSLCREMATAYVEPASRRFIERLPSGDRGAEVTGTRLEAIERIYRGAQIDARMHTANEQLVAMNNATIHVWPLPVVRGVRLVMIPPHDQELIMRDPSSTDEHDIALWRFAVPVGQSSERYVEYAVGEITPTSAMWVQGPEGYVGRGIFEGFGTANPLGQVPVVMLRGSDPGPGEWWAPAPEDLLDAQRALNHDLTDIGHVARMQGFGQLVTLGITSEAAKELEIGVETAIGLRGEGVDAKYINPNPQLEGYARQNREYLETVVATQGMNPATYMRSAGITALAKQIEIMDRNGARKRHLRELKRAEQRVYDLSRRWIEAQGRAGIFPDATVDVEYREPVVPVDRLHDAQALEIECSHGLNSWARERAKRDGVSLDEGKRRMLEDQALNAERGALNGAQVTAIQGILVAASTGQMPPETARAVILASFPIDEAAVDKMIGPLRDWTPKPAEDAANDNTEGEGEHETQTPPPMVMMPKRGAA